MLLPAAKHLSPNAPAAELPWGVSSGLCFAGQALQQEQRRVCGTQREHTAGPGLHGGELGKAALGREGITASSWPVIARSREVAAELFQINASFRLAWCKS